MAVNKGKGVRCSRVIICWDVKLASVGGCNMGLIPDPSSATISLARITAVIQRAYRSNREYNNYGNHLAEQHSALAGLNPVPNLLVNPACITGFLTKLSYTDTLLRGIHSGDCSKTNQKKWRKELAEG
jgi:hypothetical protein